MYILVIAFILLVSGFLVWASANISSRVYVKTLCRGKTDTKTVAITYDDGPDPEMTPKVLEILKKYQVKAAFFLIGSKAEQYPELVRRIVDEGHLIANHTYAHSPFDPFKKSQDYWGEIRKTNVILKELTGLKPKFFRPPFGVTNPLIAKAVRGRFESIGWSIRSFDTVSSRSRKKVCKRVVERLHPGAVILLHDRCEKADELSEMILEEMISRSYKTLRLDDLLSVKAYED